MCGIAGHLGRFSPDLLAAMSGVMAHRGPDDDGVMRDETQGLGLAQRRLSIIDLSPLGHQPMWDATETVCIVFNGEIYNYRELRETLEPAYRFRGHSDTEVLLNLYLRDGEAMLNALNGIFAFALWDTRSKSLFTARDGLGVKPFYYATDERGYLFGSELKSLLQDSRLDRTLDLTAIHHYLTYLWCPAPRTPLVSIRKLPPGTAQIVREGKVEREWTFYRLPYDQPLQAMTEDEAIEQVRGAVERAVTRQMVADVPVGAFLSGGLDSSAVVALARQHARERLQCFTIGFSGGESFDDFAQDLPYARKAAAALDVDLHEVTVGAEMVDNVGRMLWHMDEPQADPAPINALLICELARNAGIKVLLSGGGGDDIFSGYRRHYALLQEKYWAWLPQGIRRGLRAVAGALPPSSGLGRRLAKAFQYAPASGDERICGYFHWIEPGLQQTLYCPALQEAARQDGFSAPLMQTLAGLGEGVPPLNRMLALETRHFLADHNLNYTDKMSMATGVEVRVPLLDPDLVSLAARIPPALKYKGRTGKYIFKRAMESVLPREIIYRPKTGFGAPLRSWLRGPLRPMVEDVLGESSLRRRGLFDTAGVAAFAKADRDGRVDGAYPLFSLICIELWCRMFLDTTPPLFKEMT